nr:uncharacterized protein LOC106687160 [Halyomorpha halys]XP_014286370.1 uncharacterized protein LOC106687160 [Halyomorpha halys]XP_014286371.1 uncharacterized protein LOC106687160 [Halyomorpha halys]XP_014286372.1 uncharacterized protein LOC106687160 [Halyomorpha halys]
MVTNKKEYMASPTGGVKPFSIESELCRERERLRGMTDEERSWRAKWVKDQVLSHHEPVEVPQLQRELTNPIKRIYKAPLNLVYKILKPAIGANAALWTRVLTGKLLMGLFLVYGGTYYFKYNANNWTRKGGWRAVASRRAIYPGDPEFPNCPERSPNEYATRGFDQSPI